MLSVIESFQSWLNKTIYKLNQKFLPLEFYAQNVDRIDWRELVNYLPFDFLLEHMPCLFWCYRVFKTVEEINAVGLLKDNFKRSFQCGVFTREEFVKIFMSARLNFLFFQNQNIPDEWFVPLFPTFSIENWLSFVQSRTLTREQFDHYLRVCGPRVKYNIMMPFDLIPVNEDTIELLFSHPQLTIEFIQDHPREAEKNVCLLLHNQNFYDLGVAILIAADPENWYSGYHLLHENFFDEHPEKLCSSIFWRRNLSKSFIERHKEKIENFLESRPANKTLDWLRENRPEAALLWLPLLEQTTLFDPPKRFQIFESMESNKELPVQIRYHQCKEKEFRFKMTSVLKRACL